MMRIAVTRIMGILLVLGVVSACGQKGPLTFPENEETVKEQNDGLLSIS